MARLPFASSAEIERLLKCLRQPMVGGIVERFRNVNVRRAWKALLQAIDLERNWAKDEEDGRK